MSPWTIVLVGFLLGLRHATDPDHVVAVGTIVSRSRGLGAAARVGALWGLGHSATVFVVGALLLIFGLSVPPRLAAGLELCVAVMLVVLGLLNLLRKPAHHVHVTGLEPGSAARSVGVGLVHGLAGSAAVALLALGAVHDPRWAAAYLLVFGVGTLVGMTFMTVLLALPLTMGVARLGAHARHVVPIMGLLSVAMGIVLACEVGGGIFSQAGVGIFSSAPHP